MIPVQAGAAAYVDGEEKSFLDRYSDLIWFSLMGLSAIGSIGAWFASYLRKDERNTNISQRDRLLDMLTAARQLRLAATNSTRCRPRPTRILRDTLNCYENGAIDSAALTAFSIALEQFHNAVADRKTLLAAMPPSPVRSQRPAGGLRPSFGLARAVSHAKAAKTSHRRIVFSQFLAILRRNAFECPAPVWPGCSFRAMPDPWEVPARFRQGERTAAPSGALGSPIALIGQVRPANIKEEP